MMKWLGCALIAGVGGLLPTCSQLAATLLTAPDMPAPKVQYLIGLAIFFAIGAVLSIAFNRDYDLGKALVIGISAPGIITNIMAGAAEGTKIASYEIVDSKSDVAWSMPSFFISEALAEGELPNLQGPNPPGGIEVLPLDPSSNLPPKSVMLTVNLDKESYAKGLLEIGVLYPDGRIENRTFVRASELAFGKVISFPPSASGIAVSGQTDQVYPIELWEPADLKNPGLPGLAAPFKVNLTLGEKTSAWDDFYWALGAPRDRRLDINKVTVQEIAPDFGNFGPNRNDAITGTPWPSRDLN